MADLGAGGDRSVYLGRSHDETARAKWEGLVLGRFAAVGSRPMPHFVRKCLRPGLCRVGCVDSVTNGEMIVSLELEGCVSACCWDPMSHRWHYKTFQVCRLGQPDDVVLVLEATVAATAGASNHRTAAPRLAAVVGRSVPT